MNRNLTQNGLNSTGSADHRMARNLARTVPLPEPIPADRPSHYDAAADYIPGRDPFGHHGVPNPQYFHEEKTPSDYTQLQYMKAGQPRSPPSSIGSDNYGYGVPIQHISASPPPSYRSRQDSNYGTPLPRDPNYVEKAFKWRNSIVMLMYN